MTSATSDPSSAAGVSSIADAPALPVHPLALEHVHFPFRALAALAGRSPLGGGREAGMACFMAARLAQELLAARPLPLPVRSARAAAARAWLASLALPAALRASVVRLVDASAAEVGQHAAGAAAGLAAAARGQLDAASRAELEQLARALDRVPDGERLRRPPEPEV